MVEDTSFPPLFQNLSCLPSKEAAILATQPRTRVPIFKSVDYQSVSYLHLGNSDCRSFIRFASVTRNGPRSMGRCGICLFNWCTTHLRKGVGRDIRLKFLCSTPLSLLHEVRTIGEERRRRRNWGTKPACCRDVMPFSTFTWHARKKRAGSRKRTMRASRKET